MNNELKILESWMKLLNDKLDYIIEEIDHDDDDVPNDLADAPLDAPPSFTPEKLVVNTVDSGAIKPCINTYIYIWLTNGKSFWAFLTFIGKKSVSGFRWDGCKWIYFGINLKRIDAFICYQFSDDNQ